LAGVRSRPVSNGFGLGSRIVTVFLLRVLAAMADGTLEKAAFGGKVGRYARVPVEAQA
jgi:hypothetical protein